MIVVTGASGHLGANLVRTLLARGLPVRALIHEDRRALDTLDIETVDGDIRDVDTLKRAFRGADRVFHAAGFISLHAAKKPLMDAVNVMGTRNVVEACLQSGVRRLIHFSSIHALAQKPLDQPIDETRPLIDSCRCQPYDRSKALGEKEICNGIERGLDAVIINPTAIIGPNDFRPSHLGQALLAMGRGKLFAPVCGGFDWVDVRDVVDGTLLASDKGETGAKYLLSGHWVSFCDLAAEVRKTTGVRPTRLSFPVPLWMAYVGAPFAVNYARLFKKRPLYTRMSLKTLQNNPKVCHEKAARELGYQPRPFETTIADTMAWFYDNGYLD